MNGKDIYISADESSSISASSSVSANKVVHVQCTVPLPSTCSHSFSCKYKKVYGKSSTLDNESVRDDKKVLESTPELNHSQSSEEHQTSEEEDSDDCETLVNVVEGGDDDERESELGESINSRNLAGEPYFQEENDAEKEDYVSFDDSPKSLDPYISIQEEIPFPRRHSYSYSLYNPAIRKRKRSVDQHLLKGATTTNKGGISIDCEQENNRRSSNFSVSHFYPDPYSIVFSRYLDDLGSLSSYSSSAGSEATEYLPLSEDTPLSSPVKGAVSKKEERKTASGGSIQRRSNETFYDNMNFASALSTSEEYQSFTSSVPLKRICVEADGSKEWKVYDAGPRSVRTPLLCIGPACSSAEVFFRQLLNLTARGYRVMSVESPVYWSVEDWCKGLKKLLDTMNLDKVHIFGASLGGFLAQKFAEYTYHYSRVASLILCNTFLDTSIFDYHDSAMIFWMLPSVILKKLIIENITAARIMDLDIAHAIEFMIERLNNLTQQELASRMTLNCVNCHVDTFKLKQIKMTIVDVFDESALSNQAREDLYRHYTDAKLAHLKSGGNFPYLSRSDEVNLHIMVHLRSFNGTKHAAQLEEVTAIPPTVATNTMRASQGNAKKNAEDVLGLTDPPPIPASSYEDKTFKEEAASALGLPVS
ncbi:unnamed protein product [Orchesella dallaii]|uniref:Maspardin n=1 Tax=Orchesella dallaii TaxID=48710 RepID=A0ABP1R7K4_9HEXA